MSTLIRGGTVVTADERYPADVLCADGKIQEIGTAIDVPAGAAIVDAGEALVMPGGSTRTPTCSCPSWIP